MTTQVYIRVDSQDYGEKSRITVVADMPGKTQSKKGLTLQARPHKLGSYEPVSSDPALVAKALRAMADHVESFVKVA